MLAWHDAHPTPHPIPTPNQHAAILELDWLDRPGLDEARTRALKAFAARAGTPIRESNCTQTTYTQTVGTQSPRALRDAPLLAATRDALEAYFACGSLPINLPLLRMGTPFQHACWQALLRIPHAHTWSYAQQARSMGMPRAVRAIASANGKNFRSIIIPCHRVIGSDGSLTGYGGGLARKKWLIEKERGMEG
jgi:O-6-methylguanine DNA methyltransferase